MGHGRFVVFYLPGGVAAVLAQALPAPDSTSDDRRHAGHLRRARPYLLLYPRARVLVLIPLGYFSRMVICPRFWYWLLVPAAIF